jgi:hypothetical protein
VEKGDKSNLFVFPRLVVHPNHVFPVSTPELSANRREGTRMGLLLERLCHIGVFTQRQYFNITIGRQTGVSRKDAKARVAIVHDMDASRVIGADRGILAITTSISMSELFSQVVAEIGVAATLTHQPLAGRRRGGWGFGAWGWGTTTKARGH